MDEELQDPGDGTEKAMSYSESSGSDMQKRCHDWGKLRYVVVYGCLISCLAYFYSEFDIE